MVLLKAEPLSVDEVNLYGGVGTNDNHVNKYTSSSVGTAYNINGYGGMAYYSSETCGFVNGSLIKSGCTNNYNESDIKYVIDAWKRDSFTDDNIIDARLITADEVDRTISQYEIISKYNNIYLDYWMYDIPSWKIEVNSEAWCVNCGGLYHPADVLYHSVIVRPVIVLKKNSSDDENVVDNSINQDDDNKDNTDSTDSTDTPIAIDNKKKQEETSIVIVPNTLKKISIISITVGIILISISVFVLLKNNYYKKD